MFSFIRTMLVLISVIAAHFVSAAPTQIITFNLQVEPRSLDPHIANGVPEAHVILNVLEGLTRTNVQGLPEPAMAERWEISPDQKTYTFHLREAQWSNGEPVTAEDFVFGWRRCLAPETGAEYAYQLFFVEGAEDFNSGKNKDASTVGVAAITSKTLQVRLNMPTPYFLTTLAHYCFAPLKESWVKAHPKFMTDPAQYLSNGAFTLSEWRHSDRIVLKRNPKYYNASAVRLESVVMPMIKNESTALMQWEAGKLDIVENLIALPDIPRLKQEGKYQHFPYLGVYFASLNNGTKPFNDVRVRKAFSMAINRKQITESILRGGQKPALAMVPPGIPVNGKDYRETGGDLFKEDIAEAKRLLADAGFPNGRGFPRVKYLYNDREDHRLIAQALQNMWQTNLNVRVDLDVQEWKVYIQNRQRHQFSLARAGWIGDYLDPITFLDLYQTNAGNNDIDYKNPEFDKLLMEAKAAVDPNVRMDLLRKMEHKLIAEDMAVMPIFFYVGQFLQKPNVKGIIRNPLAYVYFDKAYVE